MEVERLVSALEETILFLRNSRSSDWANMSVEEIIGKLEIEIAKAKTSQRIDIKFLDLLFAPTGVIQETSIDNGWGTEFLRISGVLDEFTGYGK